MPRRHVLVSSCALLPLLLSACVTGSDGEAVIRPVSVASQVPTAQAVTTLAAVETQEYKASGVNPRINVSRAYVRGHTGKGVTIGIVDGLVDSTNPEFAGRALPRRRYTGTDAPDSRHGMAVAGIAAAARDGRGIHGVAPEAYLRNYAILNADGTIPADGRIARAFIQAARDRTPILNNSWGGMATRTTDAEARAMQALVNQGSVLVWSAGNNGLSTPTRESRLPINRPGLAKGWLVVGSVNADNTLSSFSNACGSARAWCLVAPGNGVVTTGAAHRTVVRASGTSFAAPAASGALAVLMDAFPTLTAQQARNILLRTATPLGDAAIFGRGLINLEKATRPIGTVSLGGFDAEQSALSAGSATGDGLARAAGGISVAVQDEYQRAYAATVPVAAQDGYFAGDALEAFDRRSGSVRSAMAVGSLSFDAQTGRLDDATTSLAAMSRQGAHARGDIAAHPFLGLAEEGAALSAGTGRIGAVVSGDAESGVFASAMVVKPLAGHDLRLAFGSVMEEGAALGTTGTGAWAIDGATTTTFASLALRQPLGGAWSASAAVHAGVSQLNDGGGSLVRGFDAVSTAGALSLERAETFAPGGVLSLTVAQPLRVEEGGFDIARPVAGPDGAVALAAGRLDAAPSGRETDLELSWSGPAWQDGTGRLAASVLHRLEPDHVADAPSETVVMGRFSLRF